jgi:aryl-alcohol dehydrogenase-like predicted oxidoreductase
LSQPGISAPIIGASRPLHLLDALAAINLNLDEADLAELTEPYIPHAFSFCQELPTGDQDR